MCSRFPTVVHTAVRTSAVLPATDFVDFNHGVCYVMKITVANSYPDMGMLTLQTFCFAPTFWVPAGSPSRDGDDTVDVYDINQPSLPTLFNSVLVSVSVFMALSTVFQSINPPENSRFLYLFFRS